MTVSASIIKRQKFGNGVATVANLTGDTAYPSGGYSIPPELLGMNRLESVIFNQAPGLSRMSAWDHTNKKWRLYQPKIGVCQTETIEVTAACSTAGDLTVTVTSALLSVAVPVTVAVVTGDNTVTKVADKIVAALNANAAIAAVFTASNVAGVITLTAKSTQANDSTLAIAVTVGSTGVTVGASTNGTAGVAPLVEMGTGADCSLFSCSAVIFGQ